MAADLSPGPSPSVVTQAAYSWNGLYLGLNAGYGSATDAITAAGGGVSAAASQNVPGFVGGAQIGVNYQIGSVVWGFEGDFNGSTQSTSLNYGPSVGDEPDAVVRHAAPGGLGFAFDRSTDLCDSRRRGRRAELQFHGVRGGGCRDHDPYLRHLDGWRRGLNTASPTISAREIEYLYFDTGNVDTGLDRPSDRCHRQPPERQSGAGRAELSIPGGLVSFTAAALAP